jgi:hypothetical protein
VGGIVMLADQSPTNPMGEDWVRLVARYLAVKTMRDRVWGETSGEGTTGVDDRYASAYFDAVCEFESHRAVECLGGVTASIACGNKVDTVR